MFAACWVGVVDRIISLLAALVGLIALGGAIAVHTNADSQRREMATEIAALKTSIALLGTPAPAGTKAAEIPQLMPVTTSAQASIPSAEPASSEATSSSSSEAQDTGKAMKDLQDRISSLEATTKQQASELDAARSQLASVSSAPAPTQVATADSAAITPMASGASDVASELAGSAEGIEA